MGSVSVKLENASAAAKRIRSACVDKLPLVSDLIMSDCNQFVRKQDGALAGSAHIENGGREIVWSTPYAKRVYYTGTPRKNVNPNASLRWCEVAKRMYVGQWSEYYNKLMNGG